MHLADEHYTDLLDRLRGHAVGLVVNHYGNYGDQLIQRATLELFARHHIFWRFLTVEEITSGKMPSDVTLIAEPGGGSLGTRVAGSPRRRRQLAAIPGPKIILPQTASDAGEDLSAFETVYAREETTWNMLRAVHPDVRLVPDLALSLRLPLSAPDRVQGEFLRTDLEATIRGCDPVTYCDSVDAYLTLAGRYQRVVTNRLHFGIAALLQGQACTLRPSNYHKNRSIYDTWLQAWPAASWED